MSTDEIYAKNIKVLKAMRPMMDRLGGVVKTPGERLDEVILLSRQVDLMCNELYKSMPEYSDVLAMTKHKIHDVMNDFAAIKMSRAYNHEVINSVVGDE